MDILRSWRENDRIHAQVHPELESGNRRGSEPIAGER